MGSKNPPASGGPAPTPEEEEERTQIWDPLYEDEVKAIQLVSDGDDSAPTVMDDLYRYGHPEEYYDEGEVPPIPPDPAQVASAPPSPPAGDEEVTVLVQSGALAALLGVAEAEAEEHTETGPLLAEDEDAITREVTASAPDLVQASAGPEGTAADVEGAETAEAWRGLHPASLWINLLPQTWRTLRGLWPLLLLLVVGGQGVGSAGLDLTLVLTFFAISLSRTVVHFLTLRYRLSAGKLEVRSGLLNRRSRVLDPYRIQNIELARNPFHLLAGLVELRVETAGDASTEGLLSALDVQEAQRLKDALERLARTRERATEGTEGGAQAEAVGREILALGPAELVAFGLSKRSAGTVAVLFAAAMEGLAYLDPGQAEEVTRSLSLTRVVGAVLLAFAATWIFSAGQALVRHHAFRLVLRGDRLVTEEGLLTRRSVEIPRGKVQVVRIDEPWLRRQMGFGTMYIETAALGMADGEVRQAEGVVPMVPQEQLGALLQEASPSARPELWAESLRPAHPRALYRALWGSLIQATVLGALVVWWLLPWPTGLLVFPVLLPLAGVVAWLDWKKQGWLVTAQVVVSRRGFWTRQTWVVARNKIQSVHLGQGPLMQWHHLGQITISVAGAQVVLPDVGLEVAQEIVGSLRETWTPPSPSLPSGWRGGGATTPAAPGHAG